MVDPIQLLRGLEHGAQVADGGDFLLPGGLRAEMDKDVHQEGGGGDEEKPGLQRAQQQEEQGQHREDGVEPWQTGVLEGGGEQVTPSAVVSAAADVKQGGLRLQPQVLILLKSI